MICEDLEKKDELILEQKNESTLFFTQPEMHEQKRQKIAHLKKRLPAYSSMTVGTLANLSTNESIDDTKDPTPYFGPNAKQPVTKKNNSRYNCAPEEESGYIDDLSFFKMPSITPKQRKLTRNDTMLHKSTRGPLVNK